MLKVYIVGLLIMASTMVLAVPIQKRGLKSCYKHATLTQYWIPKEGDQDMTNDGDSIKLSGPKTKKLKTKSGKVIAKVSKATYEKFQMEGTGLLEDGDMVNLDDGKDEFMKVNRKKDPYGIGSDDDIKLDPWVSVAANDLDAGTTLYIKQLDGTKLPDGKIHNGCVRVDDEGWSFEDCQLDFFVLQYSAYKQLDKALPEKVHVEKKDCQVKDYITGKVQKWAVLKGKAKGVSSSSDDDDEDDDDDDKKHHHHHKHHDKKKKKHHDDDDDDDEDDKKKHHHHDDDDDEDDKKKKKHHHHDDDDDDDDDD
ncbi:hypothetical protein LRAMOSA10918 [Lichtheimia ramosa]|uniref:3D domain-containing protein n=1 Tax=Lichtheimia ramosa TaxID=688394 RepID=A0A077WR37_9FUNG|nr:hypothetical protein LRAMOSA10918 [Lichtheimia ramosa]